MIQKMGLAVLALWLWPLSATWSAYYPIHQAQEVLYCMHQLPSGQLRLVSFNTKTGESEPLLPLLNNPTQVTFLPDNVGFSFVENGIFKIKYFSQRSAQRIEPDIPLFGYSSFSWLDDTRCLLSAYYSHNQGLFVVGSRGQVVPILWQEKIDYSYPCLIADCLFYVSHRTGTEIYSIVCNQTWKNNFGNGHVASLSNNKTKQREDIIYEAHEPIIFLTMTSASVGYFLSYTQTDDAVLFRCHQLSEADGCWLCKKLFDFVVPINFLATQESGEYFEESVRPLLPKYGNDAIYYATYDYEKKLIYPRLYDLNTGADELLGTHLISHAWVSLVTGEEIYLGLLGVLDEAAGYSIVQKPLKKA